MDMELPEIAQALQERFGLEQTEFRDQISLIVPPERIVEVTTSLRDEYGFNFLSDESAVDYWPQEAPRFHVIYQLRNLTRMLLLSLRVPLDGNAPRMPTLEPVFPNANWFERELWDMFGITFEGHSDLRRILMPYDWEGHPLRKDFPLGYEEVQFTFNVDEVRLRKPQPRE
jgi:NADH-quinone oxidoreductase subunit C